MRHSSLVLALASSAILAFSGAGCGYKKLDDVSCPSTGTKLTWENFGQGFFVAYCNTCHSASPGNRNGAPENYVFDTQAQVVDLKSRIFERSAGENDSMPPGPDDPPIEARNQLSEWLACGAP